ncbi:MAG: hypothetical protein KIT11_05525 [Fimbriimonadaceae bacterium]|nr:hypothetical protein [Fimbriimonadaceae bacterium]QYK56647.1 MAG: hypothetical protein KF733_03995 [Fimbriimonadaceae bacterium]
MSALKTCPDGTAQLQADPGLKVPPDVWVVMTDGTRHAFTGQVEPRRLGLAVFTTEEAGGLYCRIAGFDGFRPVVVTSSEAIALAKAKGVLDVATCDRYPEVWWW